MGPRSVERGKVMGVPSGDLVAELQWGRVLLNAESAHEYRQEVRANKASMGPRSVERGKSLIPASPSPIMALQWGRVLLNAERPNRLPPTPHPKSFNGAAFC